VKPGSELDALVAEKVFGKRVIEGIISYPNYSTSISDAWEVVEVLRRRPPKEAEEMYAELSIESCEVTGVVSWWVGWRWHEWTDNKTEAVSDTAPHAICLAALKAVGVGV
jgi:hypothetical protein